MNEQSGDAAREPTRPRAIDPWLRRNVRWAGSPPAYSESPLAGVWARAVNPPADASETIAKIARMREQRPAAESAGTHRLRRRRSTDV